MREQSFDAVARRDRREAKRRQRFESGHVRVSIVGGLEIEIGVDPDVARHQIAKRALGICGSQSALRVGFEHRKQQLTRIGRRCAFQILKGGALELAVIGVKRAEGDPHGIAGKQQSEQREQVFEIPVGAIEELVVEKPLFFVGEPRRSSRR